MNRRMIGLCSIILFLVAIFVSTGKTLFAADKVNVKKNSHHMPKAKIAEEIEENNIVIQPIDEEDSQESGDVAVDEFDVQQKQKDVQRLVERGVEFCVNNSMPVICNTLTHTKTFIEGELYLFLLDTKGMIYAHGDREDLIWKNMWDYRDSFGALAVQSMIKTATPTGAWLTYEWTGAVKVAFVQKIKIDNKDYILGCGFYPHSKKYAVIGLVKGAVGLFNQDVKAGYPVGDTFGAMGYSRSERFVFGDLYLYALDFDGIIRAQGEEPGLIGTNALDRKDAKGKMVNREIIDKLKQKN
ncbi:MAG TPA: cache domain-containing protein, partial [Candidatus Babeliales bacterium]|nr:cache domain-containing protein [Candidatus Babeliales bacterium]